MSKHKKNSGNEKPTKNDEKEKLIFITAIITLINSLITLITVILKLFDK